MMDEEFRKCLQEVREVSAHNNARRESESTITITEQMVGFILNKPPKEAADHVIAWAKAIEDERRESYNKLYDQYVREDY